MSRLRIKSILGGILITITAFTTYNRTLIAQTDSTPATVVPEGVNPWAPLKDWDRGSYSSVAIHPSGLFVEVHNAGDNAASSGLWYRIGKFDPVTGTVSHGGGVNFRNKGYGQNNEFFPSVAITKEGYVVIVISEGAKKTGKLKYYVGTVDPNGGTDQKIDFKIQDKIYDTGYDSTISINYNGIIAEAHEGDSSNRLYYRLGHLNSPGTGDFTIAWDTGSGGTAYDTGVEPFISLNDNGDVVEVHTSENGSRTHYTRGKLNGNTIAFSNEHPRFDEAAFGPAVTLLNSGYVMEINVHIKKDNVGKTHYELTYRLGQLDQTNSSWINWISQNILWDVPRRAGLSNNGTYAFATPCAQTGHIKYTWAIAK